MSVTVPVLVYPFDPATGERSGTSSSGKPYHFYNQDALIDCGPQKAPVVTRLQVNNRSEVLAPGSYVAECDFSTDQYRALLVKLVNFRPAPAQSQPKAVNG